MNKLLFFILVLILLQGCKAPGETPAPINTYTLTVSLGQGIDGTPASGTYSYSEGREVSYNYRLKSGYRDLKVTRNWDPMKAQGTFVMNKDYRLTASHWYHLENCIQVRTPANFSSPGDIVNFLQMISDYDIYSIEMTVKQDEDEDISSGYVFYNSRIAPVAKGYTQFDALQIMIDEAHQRGLKICAWFPQFHDKAALERNSRWQMKALVNGRVIPYLGQNPSWPEYFINPADEDTRDYQLAIIKEVVKNYDIDGVFIDWVRFDDWNMDMNDSTREAFMSDYGIDPMDIDFSRDNSQRQQWNQWRTNIIANHMMEIKNAVNAVKPALPLGVHILPPEFEEVGQDASKFKNAIDYVSMLAYWDDWGFSPSWTWEKLILQTVGQVDEAAVIPNLDTDWSYDNTALIVENLKMYYPQIKKVLWFRYGKWRKRQLDKINEVNPN